MERAAVPLSQSRSRAAAWVLAVALALAGGCKSLVVDREGAPHPGVGEAASAVETEEEVFPSQEDAAAGILSALRLELERSQRQLQRPNYPAPYFIAYRLRDEIGR